MESSFQLWGYLPKALLYMYGVQHLKVSKVLLMEGHNGRQVSTSSSIGRYLPTRRQSTEYCTSGPDQEDFEVLDRRQGGMVGG